jgi:hypothetical protein
MPDNKTLKDKVRLDLIRRFPLDPQSRRVLYTQLGALPPLAPLFPAHLRDDIAQAV